MHASNVEHLIGRRRVHPFPARMAASIPYSVLMNHHGNLNVLDPMAGSGTTIAIARRLGHLAYGVDTDPLAVLIGRVGCEDVRHNQIIGSMYAVLQKSARWYGSLTAGNAYPLDCDEETKAFIRFWFDPTNRRQLAALTRAISEVRNSNCRRILECAVSRMIIVKSFGASRAMDVAHSRPHRVHSRGPLRPLDHFQKQVEWILGAIPFKRDLHLPSANVRLGDARKLRFSDDSMDLIITSPPYLNAIDYMRGHRLSLVWLGYRLQSLRGTRSSSVGIGCYRDAVTVAENLSSFASQGFRTERSRRLVTQFSSDIFRVLQECFRVLKQGGSMISVLADSTIKGQRIRTADGFAALGIAAGFRLKQSFVRRIPSSQRYLPTPSRASENSLARRMRTETVLQLEKP